MTMNMQEEAAKPISPPQATIAAIATPNGSGGVGIVRISGNSAILIAERMFFQKKPINWSRWSGYSMHYGAIRDKLSAGNETIDEAICLVFRSPKSYTGEDVVEFSCHGGQLVLRRVLRAALAAGARLAEPGEFTRRAFLNGRIDLTEAEAVMRLIHAQSEDAARAATATLGGALSRAITELRGTLIHLVAQISAWVDYPEDEPTALQPAQLLVALQAAEQQLRVLLQKSAAAVPALEGVETVLLGKPNVGKSTLMNALAGFERSIVTEFAGTTRDTITEAVQLGSLPLRLTDTAGIHVAQDPIERLGVERSRAAAAGATLLLLLLDASQPLAEEDAALLRHCDPARTIVLCNKIDLGEAIDLTALRTRFAQVIPCSASTGAGLALLAPAAEALLGSGGFSPWEALLTTERQRSCAEAARIALGEAIQAQTQGFALDAIGICLEDAIQALFSLTGERATEAIVNEVFASFCVGK
jgi:tRNA modification GTPase